MIYECIHGYTCMCACMCTHTYAHTHTCVRTHTHTCTHTHTHTQAGDKNSMGHFQESFLRVWFFRHESYRKGSVAVTDAITTHPHTHTHTHHIKCKRVAPLIPSSGSRRPTPKCGLVLDPNRIRSWTQMRFGPRPNCDSVPGLNLIWSQTQL